MQPSVLLQSAGAGSGSVVELLVALAAVFGIPVAILLAGRLFEAVF
ncbi:hypothetical protein ACOZ4I_03810 [Haloarcula salina]